MPASACSSRRRLENGWMLARVIAAARPAVPKLGSGEPAGGDQGLEVADGPTHQAAGKPVVELWLQQLRRAPGGVALTEPAQRGGFQDRVLGQRVLHTVRPAPDGDGRVHRVSTDAGIQTVVPTRLDLEPHVAAGAEVVGRQRLSGGQDLLDVGQRVQLAAHLVHGDGWRECGCHSAGGPSARGQVSALSLRSKGIRIAAATGRAQQPGNTYPANERARVWYHLSASTRAAR